MLSKSINLLFPLNLKTIQNLNSPMKVAFQHKEFYKLPDNIEKLQLNYHQLINILIIIIKIFFRSLKHLAVFRTKKCIPISNILNLILKDPFTGSKNFLILVKAQPTNPKPNLFPKKKLIILIKPENLSFKIISKTSNQL